jgi:fucose 4-O-acetylase-like acetyltransferase
MGNIFQQWNYLKSLNLRKDFAIGTTTLLASLILFYWHINETIFPLHIALYYVVNFVSIVAFIHLSRSLNGIKSKCITLISLGTMLIFGLHRMMIGVIDFVVEKSFSQPNITYDWYQCLIIALIIEIVLIPIINKEKWAILFGKKRHIYT